MEEDLFSSRELRPSNKIFGKAAYEENGQTPTSCWGLTLKYCHSSPRGCCSGEDTLVLFGSPANKAKRTGVSQGHPTPEAHCWCHASDCLNVPFSARHWAKSPSSSNTIAAVVPRWKRFVAVKCTEQKREFKLPWFTLASISGRQYMHASEIRSNRLNSTPSQVSLVE